MKSKKPKPKNHLNTWFDHPQANELFGDGFLLRADTLAALVTRRETFKAVALRHKVTPAAVSKIAKQQRNVIGK